MPSSLLLKNSYYYDDMYNYGEIISINESDFNKKLGIISLITLLLLFMVILIE